jgi:hypothetical protein
MSEKTVLTSYSYDRIIVDQCIQKFADCKNQAMYILEEQIYRLAPGDIGIHKQMTDS